MLNSTALFAATVVVLVGALIFWSNPKRFVNRVVLSCSVHIFAWLLLLHLTQTAHPVLSFNALWLRLTCAVSALIPLHFWIVQESIAASPAVPDLKRLCGGWRLALISMVLAGFCFTDYFASYRFTTVRTSRSGYYDYSAGILGLYAFLFYNSFKTTKKLHGSQRLELQVWLGGGCAMAIAVLVLAVVREITNDRSYVQLEPLVILVFYAGTAFAITTSRIFDARQIFLVGLEKCLLIVVVATFGVGIDRLLVLLLPGPLSILVATGFALWLAVTFNDWLNQKLQIFPRSSTARQAAFDVARRESRVEKLEQAFLAILRGWGQADHALVLIGPAGISRGGGSVQVMDGEAIRALHRLRWVTPERLAREKSTPERVVLEHFLKEHRLGVAVVNEGPALDVVVGVGVAMSRRPYTYPQVTQLTELMSIIEGAFERASLSAKAQHAEQLATVGLLGASLAHEIRNPLVSIKTFVQLLPTRHQDAAFRDKFFRLMTDEVARIDRLTEQLLELASPRAYLAQMIELHAVLRTSLELVAPKAADKQVQIITDFSASPDQAYSDPSAIKQVVLNLCLNAIQAAESVEGERWVKISTHRTPAAVTLLVSDSGPGIAAEMQSRLFNAFQSTKSSGFGLGLAICRDILGNLSASIAVDPPVIGQGATFRVTIPCQPLSS